MSTPLLDVTALVLRFGGVTALSEVGFSVAQGALNAIIGPNGAGKTSLLNCISGVYRPQRGRILFDGTDVTRMGPAARTGLGIARTFQNIALFRGMTVLDNLLIGRHVHQKTGTLTGGSTGAAARRRRSRERERVEEIIDFLEIQPSASRWCTPSPTACRSASSWAARSRSTRACSCSTSRWPG